MERATANNIILFSKYDFVKNYIEAENSEAKASLIADSIKLVENSFVTKSYLDVALENLKAGIDYNFAERDAMIVKLDQKIDFSIERLDKKIDVSVDKLDKKIDVSVERLDKKIDSSVVILNKTINAVDSNLESEINKSYVKLTQEMNAQFKWTFGVLLVLLLINTSPIFRALFVA